jgi:ankyrin repeat protein
MRRSKIPSESKMNKRKMDEERAEELFEAVEKGDIAVVKGLIEGGVDVNVRDKDNNTPLHVTNNPEVAELLLKNGADLNARNKDGWTPLYLAAQQGHADVAELLIRNGADVNARNKYNETPLHSAARAL